ncbi:MAG: 16S rRNA methyltransferase [Euryarchaeota archaeon]|nr:16S rRNA methyltransferase [Euryarchaeota archaeon]
MLTLILADSELELVPKELRDNPIIVEYSRRKKKDPSKILLDSNLHYQAMKELKDSKRRGRPDIIHITLLNALDSPLNRSGLLNVYVHTRNNEIISINQSTRLPRNYNRFVGLIEQLFEKEKVPSENPLLVKQNKTIEELLAELNPDYVIVFSEDGEKISSQKLMQEAAKCDKVVAIIGGFPHGDFLSGIKKIADKVVCIDPSPLNAWTVVNRIIFSYENAIDLAERRFEIARASSKT